MEWIESVTGKAPKCIKTATKKQNNILCEYIYVHHVAAVAIRLFCNFENISFSGLNVKWFNSEKWYI